jgi:hypothetical protein
VVAAALIRLQSNSVWNSSEAYKTEAVAAVSCLVRRVAVALVAVALVAEDSVAADSVVVAADLVVAGLAAVALVVAASVAVDLADVVAVVPEAVAAEETNTELEKAVV